MLERDKDLERLLGYLYMSCDRKKLNLSNGGITKIWSLYWCMVNL